MYRPILFWYIFRFVCTHWKLTCFCVIHFLPFNRSMLLFSIESMRFDFTRIIITNMIHVVRQHVTSSSSSFSSLLRFLLFVIFLSFIESSFYAHKKETTTTPNNAAVENSNEFKQDLKYSYHVHKNWFLSLSFS